MSKIQTVHDKVQVQLDAAQQQAHDDNKRNFEQQEQRIKDLFGDMHNVATKLNDNINRTVRQYIQTSAAAAAVKREGCGMYVNISRCILDSLPDYVKMPWSYFTTCREQFFC